MSIAQPCIILYHCTSNCSSNPVFLVDGSGLDNLLNLSWTFSVGAVMEVSPQAIYSSRAVCINSYCCCGDKQVHKAACVGSDSTYFRLYH